MTETLAQIERDIAAPRVADEPLGPRAVLAIDVLYHALVYVGHDDGLTIWRDALWNGHMPEAGRPPVTALLEHINSAVEAGEAYRVSEICNCLTELLLPESQRPAHVGGNVGPPDGTPTTAGTR